MDQNNMRNNGKRKHIQYFSITFKKYLIYQ